MIYAILILTVLLGVSVFYNIKLYRACLYMQREVKAAMIKSIVTSILSLVVAYCALPKNEAHNKN